MGQVIEMNRERRGEKGMCRSVLILEEEYVSGDSGLLHKCSENQGHRGFHQCFCGMVYRDDGAMWYPQTLPGLTGGTWKHN